MPQTYLPHPAQSAIRQVSRWLNSLAKGTRQLPDEVTLATALSLIMLTPQPAPEVQLYGIDIPRLHKTIMEHRPKTAMWSSQTVREI